MVCMACVVIARRTLERDKLATAFHRKGSQEALGEQLLQCLEWGRAHLQTRGLPLDDRCQLGKRVDPRAVLRGGGLFRLQLDEVGNRKLPGTLGSEFLLCQRHQRTERAFHLGLREPERSASADTSCLLVSRFDSAILETF